MPISVTHAIIVVALTVAATFLTRLFPFALFGRKNSQPPRIVRYLGNILPPAVIAILLVYCLRNIAFPNVATYVPHLIAIGIVILLHVWKRNNLLSIGGGTICYMLMVQYLFV